MVEMMSKPSFVPVLLCFLLTAACNHSPQYQVDRGNQLFREGKFAEAALRYRKAIQDQPAYGEAHYRLAMVELKENNGTEAFRLLSRAAELMPGNEELAANLADVSLVGYSQDRLHSRVYYEAVVRISTNLLAHDPNSVNGLRLKGTIALLDKKPTEAVSAFRKVYSRHAVDVTIASGLIQALFLDNQAAEGERIAGEFLLKERRAPAIYNLLYQHLIETNRPDEAAKMLATKCANGDGQPDCPIQLARHYFRFRRPAEMSATLQKLLDTSSGSPQSRLLVGDFCNEIGNQQQALQYYAEGARLADAKQKGPFQARIAKTLVNQGKVAEALEIVEAALKQNPDDADAKAMRAGIWMDGGDASKLKAAIVDLRELVRKDPREAELSIRLGRALAADGEVNQAISQLSALLRLRSDNIPARVALTELYLARRDNDGALRTADEILQLAPGFPRARLLRLAGLIGAGRVGEAHVELNALVRDFPGDMEVRLQSGLLALHENKYQEAEASFRSLRPASSGDIRPKLGLAETLAAQNQVERAVEVLGEEVQKRLSTPV